MFFIMNVSSLNLQPLRCAYVTCSWVNRDGDQQMVDKEQLLGDDDKMEELPVANIPGLTSPQRRHSLMEEDLPGDDDVLATLLGLTFHWN
jgi:hypothetical protein